MIVVRCCYCMRLVKSSQGLTGTVAVPGPHVPEEGPDGFAMPHDDPKIMPCHGSNWNGFIEKLEEDEDGNPIM